MQPFTEKVIAIIENIPPGKVMTYGQIANEAEHPHAARQVARILHSMSKKYNLPWHRVINSKGKISLTGENAILQRTLLEREHVAIDQYNSINLQVYGYIPKQV